MRENRTDGPRQQFPRLLYLLAAVRFALAVLTSGPACLDAESDHAASGFHASPGPAILPDETAEVLADDEEGRPSRVLDGSTTQDCSALLPGTPARLALALEGSRIQGNTLYVLAPKIGPPRG